MNHCESYEPLLDAFTEGDLFMEDMVRVQQHLNNCPDCQSYIEDLLAMRAAFPTVEETEVPAGFTAGVMASVAATPQATTPAAKSPAAPAKRRTPWVKVLSGLAACCVIVLLAQSNFGMGGGSAAPESDLAAAPETMFYAADGIAEESPAEVPAAAESKLAQPEMEVQHTGGSSAEDAVSQAEIVGGEDRTHSPYRIIITVNADYIGDALDNRLPLVKYDEVLEEGGDPVHTREYELTMAEYDKLLHQLSEERGEEPVEEGFNTDSNLVLVIVRQ